MVMRRQMRLVLGLRHGERVDIVAAAGEQPDDAREHARLVVDEHGQSVGLGLLLALIERIGRSRLGHGLRPVLPRGRTSSPGCSSLFAVLHAGKIDQAQRRGDEQDRHRQHQHRQIELAFGLDHGAGEDDDQHDDDDLGQRLLELADAGHVHPGREPLA